MSITNWRQYVGHPIPEFYDDRAEPHLYDINGKRLPNRVRLDLRTVSQDITQVPEAGPSSAPSHGGLFAAPSPHSVCQPHCRTPSPIAGDKCARASEDDTVFHTAQAQKINDHQGPVRAQDYDDITQENITQENILTRVHNIGRCFHSGAQPMVSDLPAVPSLSQAAIEAAIKEFDEASATKSDGENGEKSD
ncbi:hypothetical protein GGX14DRAFT_557814 [Mycena pura]|uniref:Uncharacterized protein n=1 Tax=Mycena pura TaxID=153505 RepID=A0AAD7E103_9AGAR|nr:hypothetical protein GGX14DRAFT_557814 [Mycena pura]